MAGYIAEFFGYSSSDESEVSLKTAARKNCPFLGSFCVKTLSRDKVISGVCAIRQITLGSPNVICCPIRLYADNYKILHLISEKAFRPQPTRNVNARAAYFRGNFVNLVGSNAGIVTGEIGKIHRKDAGQR